MEIIGIICEYNPFHNGHQYHINAIKEKYPNSLIILIVNGYFLERGDISLLTKEDKTRVALKSGVDLVIELPALFGTQSADNFAYNAVYLLNKLKVEKIIFGSESNNIKEIKKLAQMTENEEYADAFKDELKKGVNYPTALANALKSNFNFLPNDILGISYVKAINKINKKIVPETIKRTSEYLDIKSNDKIISALNIRNKYYNNEDISSYVPKIVLDKIVPIKYDTYFYLLKTIIMRDDKLSNILDVDEGIENRLKTAIKKADNLEDFIMEVKTKRYTYNKINRMLIHILLSIKKEDATLAPDYLKILGLNNKGRCYIKSIRSDIDIPLIKKDSKIYDYEMKAAFIYDLLTGKNTMDYEAANKPIIEK